MATEWNDQQAIDAIRSRPSIGMARQLARNLLKEIGSKEPPISLGTIIRQLQTKYKLTVTPVFDFGEKISGVLVVFEDSAEIGFNKKQGWYRRRFTIAHEIGHLLMNTTCDNIDKALESNRNGEIMANEFAAELLIPLKNLKADFKKGVKDIGELSERYRMSREAVGWKIVHAGVLK